MLDGPILLEIAFGVRLRHPVDGSLLHSDIQAREIADSGKERQILPIQAGRPAPQVERHQKQSAEPHNQVRKKDRVGGSEDAAKHADLISCGWCGCAHSRFPATTPVEWTQCTSDCLRPSYLRKSLKSEGSNQFRSSKESGFLSAAFKRETKRRLSLSQRDSTSRQYLQAPPLG